MTNPRDLHPTPEPPNTPSSGGVGVYDRPAHVGRGKVPIAMIIAIVIALIVAGLLTMRLIS